MEPIGHRNPQTPVWRNPGLVCWFETMLSTEAVILGDVRARERERDQEEEQRKNSITRLDRFRSADCKDQLCQPSLMRL